MKRRTFVKGAAAALPALAALGFPNIGAAGELEPITLPKPEMDGGKSVLAALKDRKTVRNISPDPLPLQTLSNLLWAAFGVNRPEAGLMGKPGRTAPSASNSQEIGLYVCLAQGVYLYETVPHRLAPVAAGDFRARAGRSAAVKAPVNIFCRGSREIRRGGGAAGPVDREPRGSKILLFHGHGFHRPECLPVRGLAGPGGLVS
ncbi:MAG: nitroreductase family protein [Acidobacteria bacterium]|nr:nitroreductase family protein [Acidobacteriota bacterium]